MAAAGSSLLRGVAILYLTVLTLLVLLSCRRSTYNHLSSWLTDARNLTNPNTVSTQISILPLYVLQLSQLTHILLSIFCFPVSSLLIHAVILLLHFLFTPVSLFTFLKQNPVHSLELFSLYSAQHCLFPHFYSLGVPALFNIMNK